MQLDDLWKFADWLAAELGDGYTVISGPFTTASPDRCISVQDYDTGGDRPNWQGHYPVQILCRGAPDSEGMSSYNDAHSLADRVLPIMKPADSKPLVNLTGGHRATLEQVNGPHPLGPDEQGRWRFSINGLLATSRG